MWLNKYYENGHKGVCSVKKTWVSIFYNSTGIGEEYRGAAVTVIKKKDGILR